MNVFIAIRVGALFRNFTMVAGVAVSSAESMQPENVSPLLKICIYFIDFKMVTSEYWTKQGPCYQTYICNCMLRWLKSCHVLVLEETLYRISIIEDFSGQAFVSLDKTPLRKPNVHINSMVPGSSSTFQLKLHPGWVLRRMVRFL